jgi:hypothetical protein
MGLKEISFKPLNLGKVVRLWWSSDQLDTQAHRYIIAIHKIMKEMHQFIPKINIQMLNVNQEYKK